VSGIERRSYHSLIIADECHRVTPPRSCRSGATPWTIPTPSRWASRGAHRLYFDSLRRPDRAEQGTPLPSRRTAGRQWWGGGRPSRARRLLGEVAGNASASQASASAGHQGHRHWLIAVVAGNGPFPARPRERRLSGVALGSQASCNRMSATAASKLFNLPGNQAMVVSLSGRPPTPARQIRAAVDGVHGPGP